MHGKETRELGNDFYAVNINTKNGQLPAIYDAHDHRWIIKNTSLTVNGQKPAFVKLKYLDDSGMFMQEPLGTLGPETARALKQAGLMEQGASAKQELNFHKKLDKLVHDTFGKRPSEK